MWLASTNAYIVFTVYVRCHQCGWLALMHTLCLRCVCCVISGKARHACCHVRCVCGVCAVLSVGKLAMLAVMYGVYMLFVRCHQWESSPCLLSCTVCICCVGQPWKCLYLRGMQPALEMFVFAGDARVREGGGVEGMFVGMFVK